MKTNNCIDRNFRYREITQRDPLQVERFKILKNFVNKDKDVISIGCGSYEPILINARYACDIFEKAHTYLKKLGYKGLFSVEDVRKLKFYNKSFSVGICSEVIEHLDTEEEVRAAILEVNRVCNSWLITTPAGFSPDPDHKFHFTENQLKEIMKHLDFSIIRKGFFFYITNKPKRLNFDF